MRKEDSRRRFSREVKLAAVQRMAMGANVSELSRELGVSRKGLYQWQKQFRVGGPAAYRNRARRLQPQCHRLGNSNPPQGRTGGRGARPGDCGTPPQPGSVIHHSDRGVQYACAEYAARLAAHCIQSSMSRIGNPYDNAKAERFMRTLKEEEVDGRAYRDIIDARKRIGEFIERVYYRQRLHSALDYLSPDEYEAGLMRLRQDPLAAIQNLENCP